MSAPPPFDLLAIHRDPADPRKKTITSVRPLTGDELASLEAAIHHLTDFESWDVLMGIVEENLRRFESAVATAANAARDKTSRWQMRSVVHNTINASLVNYVTSFKLYLDHTRTRLAHRFGKEGAETHAFALLTSKSFDKSFAYRFMSQLRDYTVHCGFPVTRAGLETYTLEDGSIVERFSYAFDARHLLQNGPTYWRGKVKTDLMNIDAPFAVEPVLEESISELRSINSALVDQEKPHLHQSAQAILSLVQNVFKPNTIPAVGRVTQVEDGADWEFIDFPAHMMQRLGYWRLEA